LTRSALALALVAVLATAVFSNSLQNGFAYDDQGIVVQNPVVTDGDAWAAVGAPYWAGEAGVGRLYRPVAQAAFATQWAMFGGNPMGFHLVNLLLHAAISVLVGLLCGHVVGTLAADATGRRRIVASLVGGGLFAVHPVHVEAVSNVVGQAELWSAFGVLGAILLHIKTRGDAFGLRLLGTLGMGVLFGLAFGAKEIAVVLPILLLLVEVAESRGARDLLGRLYEHLPRILLLGGVGAFLLAARFSVLGALTGEDVTAVLAGLDVRERLAHVLPLWTEYLRLLVWPVTLAADYDPGVIFSASGPTSLQTMIGGVVLLSWIGAVAWFWARSRSVAVGLAWFLLAVLPVSNLLFATGSLMAERTLYLPSVGLSVLTAGVFGSAITAPVRTRRLLQGLAVAVLIGLSARSFVRTPSWASSFSVMQALVREHPTSWRAHKARAEGLVNVGRFDEAAAAYRAGVDALPNRFDMVAATGAFLKEQRRLDEARPFLERAVALQPERPSPWVLLGELELLQGRFREAHGVATRGIASAVESAELWGVLSEAYVGGGLLPAAVRAREAALAQRPDWPEGWRRLTELLEAVEADPERIRQARARALALTGEDAGPL
jgi:tetratricopeptide (TPR) repeat protein